MKTLGYKFFVMILTFWLIITASFFIIKTLPGGPFDLEDDLSQSEKIKLEKLYGLDQPILSQYFKYLKNILTLDLGVSYHYQDQKVISIIFNSLKYSLKIGYLSIFITFLIGFSLGVFSSQTHLSIFENLIETYSVVGTALPNFILAVFFLNLFGEKLFPIAENNFFSYLAPALVLSVYPSSFMIKIINVNMKKILNENYIFSLRAFGVSNLKILFKYSLRAVLTPVVTYIAPTFVSIMIGTFSIERIFATPGLGSVFIESVNRRDYFLILAVILLYSLAYLLITFFMEILYLLIDPRLKNPSFNLKNDN